MSKFYSALALCAILILSCQSEAPKDYVSLSGKITNHLGKNGRIQGENGYQKAFTIQSDGTFSDTFHLATNGMYYSFTDGNESTEMFLKNGDDIQLYLDTDAFDETIKYSGTGAENNNYLAQKLLLSEELVNGELFDLNKALFTGQLDVIIDKFKSFLVSYKKLDPVLIATEETKIGKMKAELLENYTDIKKSKKELAALIGNPSPSFEHYENIDGTTTSLSDLKGKYVYIDVWATWCGPCKGEIPFLKKLDKQFDDKDIVFVSISVDAQKNHDAWIQMIKEKKMGGIQLFADNSWKSDFTKAFNVHSIPRFILIDPAGKVVNADMTRPSDPETLKFLQNLLK